MPLRDIKRDPARHQIDLALGVGERRPVSRAAIVPRDTNGGVPAGFWAVLPSRVSDDCQTTGALVLGMALKVVGAPRTCKPPE